MASDADDEATEEERGFLCLAELLSRSGMVHLSIDRDPDCPTVSIMAYDADGKLRTICRRGLHGALAAAVGQEEIRRCPKCTHIKSADLFAKGSGYCRICERQRVKEYSRRDKAAQT